VGKASGREASGGVPTIQPAHPDKDGGHGAKARLCPPYDSPVSRAALAERCFAEPGPYEMPRCDDVLVVIYAAEVDGSWRARPVAEFEGGRSEELHRSAL
jgi:hypothetical protein